MNKMTKRSEMETDRDAVCGVGQLASSQTNTRAKYGINESSLTPEAKRILAKLEKGVGKLSEREYEVLSKCKEAEYLAERAAEHLRRVERLRLGLAMIEGPLGAAIQNFGAIINEQMNAQGFWESSNTGEKIALMHSELSEALEADRKGLESDHIQGFSGVEEEMADVVIRVLDFCAQNGLRLTEALIAKMEMNLSRPFKHGKSY